MEIVRRFIITSSQKQKAACFRWLLTAAGQDQRGAPKVTAPPILPVRSNRCHHLTLTWSAGCWECQGTNTMSMHCDPYRPGGLLAGTDWASLDRGSLSTGPTVPLMSAFHRRLTVGAFANLVPSQTTLADHPNLKNVPPGLGFGRNAAHLDPLLTAAVIQCVAASLAASVS